MRDACVVVPDLRNAIREGWRVVTEIRQLLFISCVMLDEGFNLSVLQFLHLQNSDGHA